jgi:hypothetical protein
MEGRTMHKALGELPATWGGMTANFMEVPGGTDFTPLLKGLPNDLCHCPHWGYIVKGSIHVRYADGTEEAVKAGEVFYWPVGHTAWTDEDTAMIDFNPEKEYAEVWAHVTKMQEKLSQEGA